LSELFLEHQLRHVGHAIDIEPAVQVVELVLEHGGEKTFQFQRDGLVIQVASAHPNVLRTLDETAQPRH
jgi:hypothetical protein